MIRVPVLSTDGKPLMPMKASRARRFLKEGKAKVVHNDLNLFCIQLLEDPSGTKTQSIIIGIDPGKMWSGIGVQTKHCTLFMAHLILPFKNITKKMSARKILRRARRGRRINRKLQFKQRCHKQKRFDNRKKKKIPPSIKANRELELRVVKELLKLFPIKLAIYEVVKAKGDKGFSPVMVGQKQMLLWLEELVGKYHVETREGWETSIMREKLSLVKQKVDKSQPTPETHAIDGITLAACHFIRYVPFQLKDGRHGKEWRGSVVVTLDAPFRVISRPQYYRRQLHFEKPDSEKPNLNQYRKRKGGTITPFGFRSGDYVEAKKAGKVYRGWIGGFTKTEKAKKVSVYDINWNRIGQFTVSKVKLLQRRTGLLVK